MKIAFFDTHGFEKKFYLNSNQNFKHEITFFDVRLTQQTVNLAFNYPCVCAFVNDTLNEFVLKSLSQNGTKLIALRSAGFNHVNIATAKSLGMTVVRVPEYSPYAIAEHALALMLTLNRKTHRAFSRVREGNFSLDGLVGFDLNKKTVGVIGTGKTGFIMAKILMGLGCKVLAYDMSHNEKLVSMGVQYCDLIQLLSQSDIITLHVPLNLHTKYILNEKTIALTKPGVMIINTGRGGLIETKALLKYLKNGHIGYAGLDVYEEEEGIFFENLSEEILQDDQLARLLTFPNVLITSHQAFLTHEALENIALTTLQNIYNFECGEISNSVF
jgi:D-lactate dehydrogenase